MKEETVLDCQKTMGWLRERAVRNLSMDVIHIDSIPLEINETKNQTLVSLAARPSWRVRGSVLDISHCIGICFVTN